MEFPIKFLFSNHLAPLFLSISKQRMPAFFNLVLNGCVNGGKSSSGSGGRGKETGAGEIVAKSADVESFVWKTRRRL